MSDPHGGSLIQELEKVKAERDAWHNQNIELRLEIDRRKAELSRLSCPHCAPRWAEVKRRVHLLVNTPFSFHSTVCGYPMTNFHVNNVTWNRMEVTCKKCLRKRKRGLR
jgi:hypothetical protein